MKSSKNTKTTSKAANSRKDNDDDNTQKHHIHHSKEHKNETKNDDDKNTQKVRRKIPKKTSKTTNNDNNTDNGENASNKIKINDKSSNDKRDKKETRPKNEKNEKLQRNENRKIEDTDKPPNSNNNHCDKNEKNVEKTKPNQDKERVQKDKSTKNDIKRKKDEGSNTTHPQKSDNKEKTENINKTENNNDKNPKNDKKEKSQSNSKSDNQKIKTKNRKSDNKKEKPTNADKKESKNVVNKDENKEEKNENDKTEEKIDKNRKTEKKRTKEKADTSKEETENKRIKEKSDNTKEKDNGKSKNDKNDEKVNKNHKTEKKRTKEKADTSKDETENKRIKEKNDNTKEKDNDKSKNDKNDEKVNKNHKAEKKRTKEKADTSKDETENKRIKEKSDNTKEKDNDKSKNNKNEKENTFFLERKEKIKEIGDFDEHQFNLLHPLFSTDPSKAIDESHNYFKESTFSTYDEFIEEVKKTQKSNCCICSWNKPLLVAGCFDCRISENSCICIPCFLAGKHDQHHSYLLRNSGAGNCDCGDPNLWKKSGNCPNHPGPDAHPDVTQMIPENRKKFITVFKAALYGSFSSHNDEISSTVFEWIQNFIQFGDGIRRCCSFAITSLGSKFLFTELMELGQKSIQVFINLLGKLVSDQLFALRMGSMAIINYLTLKKKIQKILLDGNYDKKSKPFRPIKKFLSFSFHFFQEKPLLFLIKEKQFNWVDYVLKYIQLVFDTIEKTKGSFDANKDGNITYELNYMRSIIEKLIKIDDQHDNLQKFIDKYSKLLLKYESKFTYIFKSTDELDYSFKGITYYSLIGQLYSINSIFGLGFDSSNKNKQFSITSTFSNLVDFLKSDPNLKVEFIYKATPKTPISPLLPLHHLFYCLISSRQKVGEILARNCQKKGIDFQEFCSLASIYPLRLLASLFAAERFSNISNDVYLIIKEYIASPEESFNMIFGLYQTLLGVAPNKEKMLEDVMKTFGAFTEADTFQSSSDVLNEDDFQELLYQIHLQEEIKETAHFDASIFIMSLLTDRSIITFDKILFKRLRVIELMMVGKPSSIDIETYVNDKISNPLFGDDLSSYAERVTTNDGSYFKLTNEDDFTPFFPLIFHLRRMKIFSKYEDKLCPLLKYTKLPHGLSFQECFRSPAFIALMFRCLLTENKLMETQVGLSMFILSMLNGEEFPESSYNDESFTIKCGNNITNELVNALNDKNINFTTIKIEYNNKDQKSIIELVQSKEQLGHEAIKKANIPIQLENNESNQKELQKQKKEKAGKLKEQIMKEFESKRNIFRTGELSKHKSNMNKETEEEEDNDNHNIQNSYNYLNNNIDTKEDFQCTICQNSDSNEVIGFPCLSLPCIFPSLINNQLHNLNIPLENIETVYSLSICIHTVHFKCCQDLIHSHDNDQDENGNIHKNDGKTFQCMIDRGERNCLLPNFSFNEDIFSSKPSENMIEAINDFINKAFNMDKENDIQIPFKSFAGVVSTIEVRHRSRPECLDSSAVTFLLRNLFLTLYFSYHDKEYETRNEDPLLTLICLIIKSDSPFSELKNFVKEIANTLENDYLYEFLRRSAIIEDFCFKTDESRGGKDNFIDWDEILSYESLISRFEISIDNSEPIELPLFETIQLSEKFVSLYQPPYNLDIFDNSNAKFVDLLTGRIVIYEHERKTNEERAFPFFIDYMKNVYHNGLAMFLSLTGENASDLIISCPAISRLFNENGFYVDKFGDIDRGFKRGANLSLSRDRLEKSLDKLLSGEVILFS